MGKRGALGPLSIVLIYAAVGGLWILLSDSMLPLISRSPELLSRISMVKGWVYVAVTSGLLYVLIERYSRHIEAALKEKALLLQEVHHRVKNNLAVIDSLLNMQARSASDENCSKLLKKSRGRIRSMALVHNKLYEKGDVAGIDAKDYILSLADEIRNSLPAVAGMDIALDIAELTLDMDTLIPLGLVINETLTNALLHAFEAHESPQIRLTLRRLVDGMLRYTIADNGKGLPGGFELAEGPGIGLTIVESLAGQLGGKLEVSGSDGWTTFSLVFPSTP